MAEHKRTTAWGRRLLFNRLHLGQVDGELGGHLPVFHSHLKGQRPPYPVIGAKGASLPVFRIDQSLPEVGILSEIRIRLLLKDVLEKEAEGLTRG